MKIIVPGIPVPQARMRHSNFGGFVSTYDPKAKEKKNIRNQMLGCGPFTSVDFPRISFIFYMPIPKSIRKKDVDLYNSGVLKHDKKPDVDNLIKLYLDCLDGIAIHGDQKVSLGPSIKLYHTEPKTVIWIHETSQKIQPWELDSAFLGVEEPSIPCFYEQDYPYGSESLWFQVRSLFDRTLNPPETIEPLEKLAATPCLQELINMASRVSGS